MFGLILYSLLKKILFNNLVFENEIKIINLCFNYPDKQGLLLNNINFAI